MSQDRLEENCIYGVGKAPLRVLQAQSWGFIVVPISSQMNPLDRAIYIRTKRQFADGDLLQGQYLKFDGVFAYVNTLGARRTFKAFRQLGDLPPLTVLIRKAGRDFAPRLTR